MLKTYEQWKRGDVVSECVPVCVAPVQEITFTEQELCKIKGVGSKLAKKIVENGPYSNIEEVKKIKGVGKTIMDQLLKNSLNDPND